MEESKEIKLDVSAAKKSIANAQKLGTWPMRENPPEKVSTPPFTKEKLDVAAAREKIANAQKLGTWPMSDRSFNKEVTPPFVEAIPQDPPTRTHKQAMATFHNIQKEDQQRQPEKAKIQDPPTQTHEQAMVAFHNIESQYKQSTPSNSPQIEQTPPPESQKRKTFSKDSPLGFSVNPKV